MRKAKLPVCQAVCFNEEKIRRLRRLLPPGDDLQMAARRHKALGHPARQAIVHTLSREECCVCDLARVLEKPVSTVSQHLRVLASAGLLRSRQEGKLVFYSLTSHRRHSNCIATFDEIGTKEQRGR